MYQMTEEGPYEFLGHFLQLQGRVYVAGEGGLLGLVVRIL